jgi:hypothetical protein
LYYKPEIIRMTKGRRMSWKEYVGYMGHVRNVYKLLFGKLEGKGPFGRP